MSFIDFSKIIQCNWFEFERKIFRALQHSGWNGLMFTSKSHDEGADIVGFPSNSNKYVIVQCKHTRSTSIGAKGIEDLIHACQFYDTPRGIIVTNAKLGKQAKKRIYDVKNQFNFLEWDFNYLSKLDEELSDYSAARKEPYPFQEDAIKEVLNSFESGGNRSLVMFATGLGKSIVLAEVAHEYAVNQNQNVLLLADRINLIEQLESSIWSQLPSSIDTRLWDGKRTPSSFEGVTIATQQSVSSALNRGEILPKFGLVMVDECHHALSPTFREVLVDLNPSRLLGVTATPWRGDAMQISEVFGPPVATMGIVEGIERGFLSNVNYRMFADNIDWGVIADNSQNQMTIKDLNSKLFIPSRDEELATKIIQEWNANNRPQTITFCKGIDHAKRMAELLSAMGMSSRAIHSRKMPQAVKAKHLMDFKSGVYSNLIGVDILNEGIDVPDVEMIVFARVTHSRRIFIQQLGRGLRIHPGKEGVVVLDFVADIRRISAGIRMNNERNQYRSAEIYRGPSSDMVQFEGVEHGQFVDAFLADAADLDENDRIRLDFIQPI
jgi:superfamily II DNA or RNA helicase